MIPTRFIDRRLLAALAAIALTGAAPPPANPLAWRILALHNGERAAVGSAPLAWDPVLAAGAASWAGYLAGNGLFVHSDRKARRGVGENLMMGRGGYFGIDQMVQLWVREKRHFIPGIYPANSSTGNWVDTVHYTQMIWPATERIGCALATGRGNQVLVCRYAPVGNIDGRALPAPRR